jgi:hypothetical protein
MFPRLNQNGDDRRDGNLSSPYRHPHRHPSKSSVHNGFGLPVTIGDDNPNPSVWNDQKTGECRAYVYKGWTISSPIVTQTRLTAENKAVSAVTIGGDDAKTAFYRHPHRHRHGVCNGEASP